MKFMKYTYMMSAKMRRDIDPVSMGKYGYKWLSSGLGPVVQITGSVSMD